MSPAWLGLNSTTWKLKANGIPSGIKVLNARRIPLEFEDLPYLPLGVYIGPIFVKLSDAPLLIMTLKTGNAF
jgi:hypothetical protein